MNIDSVFDAHHRLWEQRSEDEQDDAPFTVDRHRTSLDDMRPWLVWIHPGDACESDSPDTLTRSRAKQLEAQMGREILDRIDTHRVFVLHRQSSAFAFEPWEDRIHPDYAEAMARCLNNEEVTLLWGDDLDAASQWLLEQRGSNHEVFLTGAWCHPDWGCVTAVGEALVTGGLRVSVSEHSPSEPGSTINGWRPPAQALARSLNRYSK